MKRYLFRLAAVLRLRRVEEERARHDLAETNARLRALLVERDRLAEHARALAGRQAADHVDGLAAERLDAELATSRLAGAERRVAEAASAAAFAQVAWTTAHRRVVALERLEERRRAEHAAEALREEIAFLDDLSTTRYVAASPEEVAAR